MSGSLVPCRLKKMFAKYDSLFPLGVACVGFVHSWDETCLSRKLSNTASDVTDALHFVCTRVCVCVFLCQCLHGIESNHNEQLQTAIFSFDTVANYNIPSCNHQSFTSQIPETLG